MTKIYECVCVLKLLIGTVCLYLILYKDCKHDATDKLRLHLAGELYSAGCSVTRQAKGFHSVARENERMGHRGMELTLELCLIQGVRLHIKSNFKTEEGEGAINWLAMLTPVFLSFTFEMEWWFSFMRQISSNLKPTPRSVCIKLLRITLKNSFKSLHRIEKNFKIKAVSKNTRSMS